MLRVVVKCFFKIFFTFSIIVNNVFSIYGQDKVDIRINFNDLDSKDLFIHFENGKFNELININKEDSSIIVKRPSYSVYPRLKVSYKKGFSLEYFVDGLPAILNLHFDEKRENGALYSKNTENLTLIYDTTSNVIYRDLRKDQEVELKNLSNIFNKHGQEVWKSDSLKNELSHLAKIVNKKSLLFIKDRPDDFFSFYYFIDQVVGLSSFIEKDSDYYSMLLSYFNETFPDKYLNSSDGQRTRELLQRKISPLLLKVNDIIPLDTLIDIHGNEILINNVKEEFLLLDFWASWCGPCIRQIPNIKSLRNEFSEQQVKFIGISIDRDSTEFLNSIKENEMNWTHVFDKNNLILNKLDIKAIPTLILIDRKGKILYKGTGDSDFKEKITAIINKEMKL